MNQVKTTIDQLIKLAHVKNLDLCRAIDLSPTDSLHEDESNPIKNWTICPVFDMLQPCQNDDQKA